MSALNEYITGVKGAIGIIASIVTLTAFVVLTNQTANSAEKDNESQDTKIEAMEVTLHELDKNVALIQQSAKRQENADKVQSADIREIKQLVMEIVRKQ